MNKKGVTSFDKGVQNNKLQKRRWNKKKFRENRRARGDHAKVFFFF